MLKINMKDGSILLLSPRMHTVYPHAEGRSFYGIAEPCLVAHFEEGPPEYVDLSAVKSICDMPNVNSLRSELL